MASPIGRDGLKRTFSNLADGSIFTANGNNLRDEDL